MVWYYGPEDLEKRERGIWHSIGSFWDRHTLYIVYEMNIINPIQRESRGTYTGLLRLISINQNAGSLKGTFIKLEDIGQMTGDINAIQAQKTGNNPIQLNELPGLFLNKLKVDITN
jgi:hypothetical protein